MKRFLSGLLLFVSVNLFAQLPTTVIDFGYTLSAGIRRMPMAFQEHLLKRFSYAIQYAAKFPPKDLKEHFFTSADTWKKPPSIKRLLVIFMTRDELKIRSEQFDAWADHKSVIALTALTKGRDEIHIAIAADSFLSNDCLTTEEERPLHSEAYLQFCITKGSESLRIRPLSELWLASVLAHEFYHAQVLLHKEEHSGEKSYLARIKEEVEAFRQQGVFTETLRQNIKHYYSPRAHFTVFQQLDFIVEMINIKKASWEEAFQLQKNLLEILRLNL